ncbi:hypothetical protein LTR04_003213 [Oleoguttula sp. CCFEE 6159]|nr:hypothetical protein LTR04_003213 [Oleoguttula sp. CCFEE 6159]
MIHSILIEKDSRRIMYFACLNFTFMLVQGFYGWVSGSLGLLSDTVHMFFDCLGLVVGIAAAVASKWPISADKPYGWGKLNTLSAFGNGIFLLLVSFEFVMEAVEGILEKKELRRVEELLIVSILGFLVNLVGLFGFGHAHAGHDHGHSHGGHDYAHSDDHSDGGHDHRHDHSSSHSHSHNHEHDESCGHPHDHSPSVPPTPSSATQMHLPPPPIPVPHANHSHANENMHGIFLHILSDLLGSAAVIVSTLLHLYVYPWYGWDPLATIVIAVLIFVAAIPLVISTGKKLILSLPSETEYSLREALQGVSELRGVKCYAVPRFWLDDKEGSEDHHGHSHGHDHGGGGDRSEKVLGVIHIIATKNTDLEDVRERTEQFLKGKRMDIVVHVERDSGGRCWCGGGNGGGRRVS